MSIFEQTFEDFKKKSPQEQVKHLEYLNKEKGLKLSQIARHFNMNHPRHLNYYIDKLLKNEDFFEQLTGVLTEKRKLKYRKETELVETTQTIETSLVPFCQPAMSFYVVGEIPSDIERHIKYKQNPQFLGAFVCYKASMLEDFITMVSKMNFSSKEVKFLEGCVLIAIYR